MPELHTPAPTQPGPDSADQGAASSALGSLAATNRPVPPPPPGPIPAMELPAVAASHASPATVAGTPAPPAIPGYEILDVLGRGGMGVVYKARQIALNRLVAFKMILAGDLASDEQMSRFRTEAAAVARLQHPNVVQIYEVGEHNGLPFFSLEFVEGGSLACRLDGTPLLPRPAAQLVQTLARAIQVAHQHGVVHRDLKPANVLLSPVCSAADGTGVPGFGVPKITDFGLAKMLDQTAGPTATGDVIGTPSYMAPEQTGQHSQPIGPATDIYALGAILYELLTGRPPFKGATPVDTVFQVVHDEPVSPRRLQTKLPRDLETVCLKCLHKEPAQRYASAEGLADDLGRFLGGQPVQARQISAWQRAVKWVRRRPALAGLLAVAALALASLIAGALWHNAQQSAALSDLKNQQKQTRLQRDRAHDRLIAEAEVVNQFSSEGERQPRDEGPRLGAAAETIARSGDTVLRGSCPRRGQRTTDAGAAR
jgi:eukaryotic-like serine/threonine-protein kinase